MKNQSEVQLGWRLSLLPIWQRRLLFIAFFMVAYPFILIVLLIDNTWRSISDFAESLCDDIKHESGAFIETWKVLNKKTTAAPEKSPAPTSPQGKAE